jgi:hypothetical protein
MARLGRLTLVLGLLAGALPAAAASTCSAPAAAPPLRRGGTAAVKVSGSKVAQGSYPAACGAYFVSDVPKVAKAGDGLVFQTCIPGLGMLQVNGTRRKAGLSDDAGLVLNADGASYLGSADKENRVTVGADLFSATVTATLRPVRRPKRGAPPDEIHVEARFDCSK